LGSSGGSDIYDAGPERQENGTIAMSEISIRAARSEDQELLSAMLAASYASLKGSYDPHGLDAALPYMSRANPKLLAGGTYYLAAIGGEPAGCGGWSVEKPGCGEIRKGIAHIRHFATHPDHVRKGVARSLLLRCLAEASAAGIRTMRCQSTLPAEGFYRSAGFRRLGVIEVEMGPDLVLPAVDMRLELSKP
jgi:GNAT superfamily N-acetyltransferase